ncbi:GGDEF domain-containing protein [Actinoplanes sp. LDG1-06]|uniref:GGDEF domain-containing protein n=1 Tax=Paractinoplanes ovalisporus TaxID=2810368 RepID=A0ABS2AR37_9ACTN|nr:GGDEF domain-containing protein [Actinoplanes ovalisporus]MBM2622337.1 GGDEF domain-containing protein [Actinoplanes ovalisporus]
MPRAASLFVVGGLAVAAAWSGLHQTWIGFLPAAVILVVMLVVVRMRHGRDADLRALRRAVAREQVLSELGAALITTTDREEVRRLAVRAAETLLADLPGVRATVTGLDADGFHVTSDGELPAEVLPALRALHTQAVLALTGVALNGELTDRALRDPLTGLGNRAMLRERLSGAIARARRSGRPVGALLLDLNGFKQVNDLHGHDVGDQLLRTVAERLRECVREEDTVSRLGGDEFVVLTEDLSSARDALVVAERIVASLGEVIVVGQKRLRTPASVGVALSHSGLDGPDDLLRLADGAMHEAKRRGGGGLHLHGVPEIAPVG